MKKLSEYFDCSVDYLIGKSDISNPYKGINLPYFTEEMIEHLKEYIEFLKWKYKNKSL